MATFFSFVLLLLLVEVFSLFPNKIPPQDKSTRNPNYQRGVFHVHSRYSVGGGTLEEIVEGAQQADLDFLILTDVNNTLARHQGWNANTDGLDVFVETETITEAGRTVFFYSHTDQVSWTDNELAKQSWRHFSGESRKPGVFLAIAHPNHPTKPWTRLDRTPEGIELVNFDSTWTRLTTQDWAELALTSLTYPFNNYLGALRFIDVSRENLDAWDTMNSVSPGHFGFAGHGVHSLFKLGAGFEFRWNNNRKSFLLASNIVYVDDLSTDYPKRQKQLYRSISNGRLAIVFQVLHPFDGNDWKATCGNQTYRIGDSFSLRKGCQFEVSVPSSFPYRYEVQLWKDGKQLASQSESDQTIHFPIEEAGTYRVEVWAKPRSLFRLLLRRDIPYVLYNPIYVRE